MIALGPDSVFSTLTWIPTAIHLSICGILGGTRTVTGSPLCCITWNVFSLAAMISPEIWVTQLCIEWKMRKIKTLRLTGGMRIACDIHLRSNHSLWRKENKHEKWKIRGSHGGIVWDCVFLSKNIIFILSNSPCKRDFFWYFGRMKQRLKRYFVLLAQAITILFTALTIALIIISFLKPEWIKDGVGWIGGLIQSIGNWNYLIAFLSACIESLPIIWTAVPGMNIMILVGGFWGKTHMIGTIWLAALGAMLGNYLGYWIWKWYGVEIIDKYGDYFGLGRTEIKILHRQLERNGFWYIVLGKFHNFTRAFIPFIAGSSGMSEKNFWTYNMIGSFFWAISINLIGILFIDNYEIILDNFGKVTFVIIILFALYLFLFKRDGLKRYMKDKEMEILEKSAKRDSIQK